MNTGREGTGGWLGVGASDAGTGVVASIAATSGVCDCFCMERPQDQGVFMEELARRWVFQEPLAPAVAREASTERQRSDSRPYVFLPACLQRLSWPPACRESDKRPWPTLLLLLPPPGTVPAQSRGRGGGSWRENRKLGGQAPGKRPPHKTS